jgi:tetratricopeptide (TPR) repeat protein
LAQIAAVCGATFDLELLSQTAGWDDGPLIDGLAELLQRQFIRSTAAHERGGYAFSHALIHASVLETLDERARRRTHRLAARVLESRAAGTIDAAEIARHWAAAGDAQRAAAAYAHAARGSLAANARTEAAALATRGLQFATDPQVRYDLIETRIAANRRQAPVDVLRADVDLLRQVAQTLDDNARFEAARAAFEVEELSGDSASRSAAMEQLHRYCDGASASVRGAQIADAQARHDALRERFSDALAHARDASARYAACGKPREALAMSIFVARVLVNQIRLDDALAVVTSVESQIVTLDDPVLSIDYWYVRGIIPSRRRDPAAALHAAKMLHDLARSVGDRIMEGHAAVLRSAAYSHLSQLSQALRELDAAEEIFTSIGVSAFAEVTRNNRASILLQIGRVDEATLILREQYADARATGADDSLYFAASNLGCAMLASDPVDEALRLQREALAIARSLESDGHAALALGDLGAAEVAAGDPVAGSAHLREAIAINRQLNRTAVLAHDLARAACAESDVDAAAAHARGALAIVEADPTQIALAPEILHRSAIALERAADRSAAAFCMRRARELLAERLAALDTADRKLYVALPWHAALSEPQEAAMQLAPGRNNASAAATASSRYANPARS